MKLRHSLALCLAATLCAQTPAPKPQQPQFQPIPGAPGQTPAAPAPAAPSTPLTPETVVVTVNGKSYTKQQIDDRMKELPPNTPTNENTVGRLILVDFLSGEAKKLGLDQKSPYKESLQSNMRQYMANAVVQDENTHIRLTEAELTSYYEAHQDEFESVKISAIYIGYTPNLKADQAGKPGPDGKPQKTDLQAKAKADALVKQLRAGGADFAKLAKENSDDKASAEKGGEFATIRRSDKYPDTIKNAIFKLKPGEISDPVAQSPGFYIFRLDARNIQPYKDVQEQVFSKVRGQKFDTWMKGIQTRMKPEMLRKDYFTGKPAEPAQPPATPDTAVVKVDGKPVTAKEVDELLKLLPPQGRAALKTEPEQVLAQLFLIYSLSEEAYKRKLEQESPHKESLATMTKTVMANAYTSEYNQTLQVSQAELDAVYKKAQSQFEVMKISAIKVAFETNPKPGQRGDDEAKARAEEIVKKLRAPGADFAALAKTDSDDKDSGAKGGEYASMRKTDNFPPAVKDAILKLKEGEISEPVRQPGGYYVFKLTSKAVQPYSEVASTVALMAKQEKYQQWATDLQRQYTPKIERPDYFKK